MQSNLSLTTVILTELKWLQQVHVSSQTTLLRALTTQISSPAKYRLSTPAKRVPEPSRGPPLFNVGSQRAWSIRHFSLSRFLIRLCRPQSWYGVNRTLSPGTPALPSPYSCRHPHWDCRIYLEAQEFKEALHLLNKKGIHCNLQVTSARQFSYSPWPASEPTRAASSIDHLVGKLRIVYN